MTYAALGRADVDVLQAICDCSGYKSKYGKKEIIHRMMQFGYDSFGPEVLGDKNVMQVCLAPSVLTYRRYPVQSKRRIAFQLPYIQLMVARSDATWHSF